MIILFMIPCFYHRHYIFLVNLITFTGTISVASYSFMRIIILILLLIKCWLLYYSVNHEPIYRFYFYCYGFIYNLLLHIGTQYKVMRKKKQWHSCTLYFIENIFTSILQFLQQFYIPELEQSFFFAIDCVQYLLLLFK